MIGEAFNVIISMSSIFVFLYLASLGNSLVEKSGILNLAIDGAYTLGVALVFTLLVFVNDPTLTLLITSLLIGLLGVLIAFLTTETTYISRCHRTFNSVRRLRPRVIPRVPGVVEG